MSAPEDIVAVPLSDTRIQPTTVPQGNSGEELLELTQVPDLLEISETPNRSRTRLLAILIGLYVCSHVPQRRIKILLVKSLTLRVAFSLHRSA
jgi:hypothetical protein